MKRAFFAVILICMLAGMTVTGCKKAEDVSEKNLQYDTMDVFNYVTVDISGIAPYATAVLHITDGPEWLDEQAFELSKNENIKNGDVIEAQCLVSEETANQWGYHIVNLHKIYYVQKLDQYINDVAQISGTALQDIVDENIRLICEDTEDLKDRMIYKMTGKSNYLFQYNKEWVEDVSIKEVILCSPMDYTAQGLEKNVIFVVYDVVLSNADYQEAGSFFFRYDNGIISGDGQLFLKYTGQEQQYYCDSNYEELYHRLIGSLEGQYYVGRADSDELVCTLEEHVQ